MNSESFLSLLQFSDGLFPAGSYAHSFGLETYVAEGQFATPTGVERFLLSYLQGSVAPADALPRSRRAERRLRAKSGAEQCCLAIDRALDAMKPASELRDASRQMGRQVLRIAADLGEPFYARIAADLFRAVESDETPGHHAMAFGVGWRRLGWPRNGNGLRDISIPPAPDSLPPHCACCRWAS